MDAILLLILIFSLSIYLVPALLSRKAAYKNVKDFVVSSEGVSFETFQNASVAYAVQMATFGPFFIWGMTGDTIGPTINCLFLLLGLLVIWWFLTPICAFLESRLPVDGSITPHAFIAAPYGRSRAIQVTSSRITIIALLGIAVAEMMGVAAIVEPLLPKTADAKFLVLGLMFFMMILYTVLGGNDGVMRSEVLQLRFAYCSLVGVIGIFLWEFGKSHTASGQSASLILLVSITCAVLTTAQIISISSRFKVKLRPARMRVEDYFRGFERVVSSVTILGLILIATATAYLLVGTQRNQIGFDSLNSLFRNKTIPWIGLLSLAVLPLFYQVADITNWQRLAAALRCKDTLEQESVGKHVAWYAIEATAFWFLLLLMGALAALAINALPESPTFETFIQRLTDSDNSMHFVALALLVLAVFAIALSTIDSVLSAAICAFRYDVLATEHTTNLRGLPSQMQDSTIDVFQGVKFAVFFFGMAIAMVVVSDRWLEFGTTKFVAILLAFYSAQLSFLPLISGALMQGSKFAWLLPSKPFALGSLVAGAVSGIGLSVYGTLKGSEFLSWAGIPVSLLLSSLVYGIGVCLSYVSPASPNELKEAQ